jgi:hypothetical protein
MDGMASSLASARAMRRATGAAAAAAGAAAATAPATTVDGACSTADGARARGAALAAGATGSAPVDGNANAPLGGCLASDGLPPGAAAATLTPGARAGERERGASVAESRCLRSRLLAVAAAAAVPGDSGPDPAALPPGAGCARLSVAALPGLLLAAADGARGATASPAVAGCNCGTTVEKLVTLPAAIEPVSTPLLR